MKKIIKVMLHILVYQRVALFRRYFVYVGAALSNVGDDIVTSMVTILFDKEEGDANNAKTGL